MDLLVPKLGGEMIDPLHGYGLAIVVAEVTPTPVEVVDVGYGYRLHCPKIQQSFEPAELFEHVLRLPNEETIKLVGAHGKQPDVAVDNLDGLLATLFTTPGKRAVSVHDLYKIQQRDAAGIQAGLSKAKRATDRWIEIVKQKVRGSRTWLADMVAGYSPEQLNIPLPIPISNQGPEITISMMNEPAFSHASRRVLSDGLVAHRSNVSIGGCPYAAVLCKVAAARFLRAQRVGENHVNIYMPLAKSMMIYPELALPRLKETRLPAQQALARQWLKFYYSTPLLKARWSGLAYQTLQTQGIQQSISINRGVLDYSWLDLMEISVKKPLIDYWLSMLRAPTKQLPFEIDDLLESLTRRRLANWLRHVREVAFHAHNVSDFEGIGYTLTEVKEVTKVMSTSKQNSISSIFEREEGKGTLRYGRALRLLGNFNVSSLNDIIDLLDTVRDRDTLLHVLSKALQECELAKAKTKIIIIPDEHDLEVLAMDIEQHSAQTIATLLIALSVHSYPRRADMGNNGPDVNDENS